MEKDDKLREVIKHNEMLKQALFELKRQGNEVPGVSIPKDLSILDVSEVSFLTRSVHYKFQYDT